MRIAVLVTCFNRVQTTLRGLAALQQAFAKAPDVDANIFLVDDGSKDGTGDKVKAAFPQVHVIQGTGSLFWNGGMCLAFASASSRRPFDAYLLYNDDVEVFPDAVISFLRRWQVKNATEPTILVGSTVSEDQSTVTYAGYRVTSKYRPRAMTMITPKGEDVICDTFNGNFVLIPSAFFEKIGGLDKRFKHAFGDIALGLSAQRAGISSVIFASPIGVCARNDLMKTGPRTRQHRKKLLQHPSQSFADFRTFVREFRPPALYPLYWISFLAKRQMFLWTGKGL